MPYFHFFNCQVKLLLYVTVFKNRTISFKVSWLPSANLSVAVCIKPCVVVQQ